MRGDAYPNGQIEREIVLSRVVAAPRDVVFAAWSDSRRMFQWFAPAGMRCDVHAHGLAEPGAVWRFDMIGTGGERYGNRMRFIEVVPNQRLVFEHGADQDDDPARFLTTITFDQQDDGKTVVTLRQLHPTTAQRQRTIGFGAVEIGYQTLEGLVRHLERSP